MHCRSIHVHLEPFCQSHDVIINGLYLLGFQFQCSVPGNIVLCLKTSQQNVDVIINGL